MTIAFYLQDGVEVLDFAGPLEVFTAAGFEVFTVSKTKAPITSQGVLKVVPDYDLESAPSAEILAFFGGNSRPTVNDPEVISWVNRQSPKFYFSVCTGAFILAKAGVLDGLTATTFHEEIENFRALFPQVKVRPDVRFVENGKVITTAGVSAGIDGALHLVGRLLGNAKVLEVVRYMEYDNWQPEQGLIIA